MMLAACNIIHVYLPCYDRREREANAARKLRAAQAREWDCGKSMEGWT